MALSAHMQEALEAKEQEVQRLAEGQREVSTDRPSESPDPRTFFTLPSWTGPLKPQAAKNSIGCWLPHQGSLPSVLGTLSWVDEIPQRARQTQGNEWGVYRMYPQVFSVQIKKVSTSVPFPRPPVSSEVYMGTSGKGKGLDRLGMWHAL